METKLISAVCTGKKLALIYPCPWLYKLIGPSPEKLRQAIAAVLRERECLITPSHTSSSGKYHCLDVEIVVHNEEDRTRHYEAFRKHPAVIMVL